MLHSIAADTWKFYAADVDPNTNLPLDNLGPGAVRGTYTSAADIGVYLWAVVAAHDLGLIDRARADSLISATLDEVATLKRYDGFLYQWYDTNNGNVLLNPGQGDCTRDDAGPGQLLVRLGGRQRLVRVRADRGPRGAARSCAAWPTSLLDPMNFSIFYDNRAQTDCNVNAALGNQHTGTMYGGYYVDQGPAPYHVDTLYSDPRIAIYMGMGMHQMPGDVWWRTWRTLPPKQCPTDPDFSYAGPVAAGGVLADLHRPAVGQEVQRLGGPLHLPRHLADVRADLCRRHVRGADGQPRRARNDLGTAQLGPRRSALGRRSRSSTRPRCCTTRCGASRRRARPTTPADYGGFGVEGLAFGAGEGLAQCNTCATETTVSPHASAIALPVLPQEAYANLEALRSRLPRHLQQRRRLLRRGQPRRPARSATGGWCSTSR